MKVVARCWELLAVSGYTPHRVADAARCCRCQTPLSFAGARQPQVCDHGCGEWLSLAAVDEHLFPQLLAPLGAGWWKLAPTPPPCAICGNTMQAIAIAELFYRCPEHGIWFDKNHRDVIDRALAEEIAKHREARGRQVPHPRGR
jgi:hypothetical protein